MDTIQRMSEPVVYTTPTGAHSVASWDAFLHGAERGFVQTQRA
jgi:hypothetical protein